MKHEEDGKPPVFLNKSADPEMDKAFQKARQTFKFFWRELTWEYRRIIPGLELASVKAPFSDPGDDDAVEQMWIGDVEFDGTDLKGTLLNQPNWLTSVNQGDDVSLALDKLSDWMYSIHGEVYGAFTVNLMRSRMSKSERKDHDSAWGLDFGDPDSFRVVPPSFLGDKPAKKGLLGKMLGGGKQVPQDLKRINATEHPMALNMAGAFPEMLESQPPNAINQSDPSGMTMLHSMALGGSAACVKAALQHGADASAKNKHGQTALDLAKRLGWQDVVAVLA